MSAVVRARRALKRPGAWIEAMADGYVVRSGPTRRARVAVVFDETVFRSLIADPGLAVRRQGGWSPRQGGPAATRADAGRTGLMIGDRPVIEASGQLGLRKVNLGCSAVRWLAARTDPSGRPLLTARQVAAAERLGADAERAAVGASLTMRWDALPRARTGRGPGAEPGDGALAAGRRVEAALKACGPDRSLVDAICIRMTSLQVAEREQSLRPRTGRSSLARGLTALADHYGIGRG